MADETVKLSITIDIHVSDDSVDTGVTVTDWNAMSDQERSQIMTQAWEIMAQNDGGGISVVTEGATD